MIVAAFISLTAVLLIGPLVLMDYLSRQREKQINKLEEELNQLIKRKLDANNVDVRPDNH